MVQIKLLGYRKNNKVNQSTLANLINVSLRTYSDKEQGKIQFKCDEMFKIAEYFGVTVDEIFLPRILQNGVKGDNQWKKRLMLDNLKKY